MNLILQKFVLKFEKNNRPDSLVNDVETNKSERDDNLKNEWLLNMIFFLCLKQQKCAQLMEQCAFKKVNYCLNTNIYSYLQTSDGKSCDLYLNVIHFFNTSVN